MKDAAKTALIVIVILAASFSIRYIAKNNAENDTKYDAVTKSGYLKVVERNFVYEPGGATKEQTLCAYSYLIDEYGVEETLKMDERALADENDVDPRLWGAVDKCL